MSQTDRDTPGLSVREKTLEELVSAELPGWDKPLEELAPQSFPRTHNLLSLLYFPDVVPGEAVSSQRELFLKLSPDMLLKNRELALCCVFEGAPTSFVLWLHNRLNFNNSLSCLDFKNFGSGQGNGSLFQNASSALDAEGHRVMKRLHLHAFCSALVNASTSTEPEPQEKHTIKQHNTAQ